jgi:uncharacterized protein DUF6916
MLDLTSDRFAPHVGEAFRTHVDDGKTLDLELIAVATAPERIAVAARERGGRVPFSLVFRGPRTPLLPQRIYRLEHAIVGTHDIFLVPIGVDAGGLRYEAVFG